MSNQTNDPTKVASKMQELAEVLGEDLENLSVKVRTTFGTKELDGEAVKDALDDTSEAGEEQTPSESEDTIEDGEEEETTIEDGEVACQCGAVFDSKAGLNGHLAHCDSQSKTEEDSEDTTEGGESEPEHPSDAENPTQENYVFHFGTCSEEDCSYGANGEEADYCASHQSSTDDDNSDDSPSVNFDDLTSGQQAAVIALIEDEGKSLEEAKQMV